MKKVLITISRGIIDQVVFFEDPGKAIRALSAWVKAMDPENQDVGLYDTKGLIANAKNFLDDQDSYQENLSLIKELSQDNS
jgi:hypothetical protein